MNSAWIKRKSSFFTKLGRLVLYLLALFWIAELLPGFHFVFPPAGNPDADLKMTVLDVGQGLGILFESDGHAVLYDGGGREKASYVVSYLQQQDIAWLDAVIVSHYDEDHLAGAVGAIYSIGCDRVIAPDYEVNSLIYQSFRRAVEQTLTPVEHPSPGEIYSFGSARIRILGPGVIEQQANNNCVAVKVTAGMTDILVCGDAEAAEEDWLISSRQDLRSDVYIVNHHGSDTSTSGSFLRAVDPEYAFCPFFH